MRKEAGHATQSLRQKPNTPIVTYGWDAPRFGKVRPKLTYAQTGVSFMPTVIQAYWGLKTLG
jgi:hypothetical protein